MVGQEIVEYAEPLTAQQRYLGGVHVGVPALFGGPCVDLPEMPADRFAPSSTRNPAMNTNAIQAIWQDVMRVEIPARTTDEPRWLGVGLIDGKHWSVVVTYRGPQVRIISARRSRKEEAALYKG